MKQKTRISPSSPPRRELPPTAATASPGGPATAVLLRRAAAPGAPLLSHGAVLQLQRTVGNHACAALIAASSPPLQRARRLNAAREREWQKKSNKNKRSRALRVLLAALKPLTKKADFSMKPLRRQYFRMSAYHRSQRGAMSTWNARMGAFVQDVYGELVVAQENKAASRLRDQLDSELAVYAEVAFKPKSGQPQSVAGHSTSGVLDGRKYHEGTSSDPIPITFYKMAGHYHDIHPLPGAVHRPLIPLARRDPYTVVNLPASDPVEFPQVGWQLQDRGHTLPRIMNTAVRKALSKHGYDLTGLEIDHVKDMGFGGQDSLDNCWPLASPVNQRPHSGAWRSRYRFLYWNRQDGTINTASINSPGMAGKYYEIKGFSGMETLARDALPSESGQPFAGSWDTS